MNADNPELVIIDSQPSEPARGSAAQPVHDFYEFEVNLGATTDVPLEPLPTPSISRQPLFRPEQIDEMNAFGAATEQDAFE